MAKTSCLRERHKIAVFDLQEYCIDCRDNHIKELEKQVNELRVRIMKTVKCKMDEKQLEILREWVRAEIAYETASNEEGSDGYRQSANGERDHAEDCFKMLKQTLAT